MSLLSLFGGKPNQLTNQLMNLAIEQPGFKSINQAIQSGLMCPGPILPWYLQKLSRLRPDGEKEMDRELVFNNEPLD